MDIVIACLLLAGTTLQTITSLRDLLTTRRRELEWWQSEEELVDEVAASNIFERLRVRRELRALRDPQIAAEIRHMNAVLAGWTLLWLGAALAAGYALWR